MRPLYIPSKWQTVECPSCGALILADTEDPTGLTLDPDAHEDGCPDTDEEYRR